MPIEIDVVNAKKIVRAKNASFCGKKGEKRKRLWFHSHFLRGKMQ